MPEIWRDRGATEDGVGVGVGESVAGDVRSFCPSRKAWGEKPWTWDPSSSCRKRSGSVVTAIVATSLMSGNIVLPSVATADNLLGAHSPEVAGEGSG